MKCKKEEKNMIYKEGNNVAYGVVELRCGTYTEFTADIAANDYPEGSTALIAQDSNNNDKASVYMKTKTGWVKL